MVSPPEPVGAGAGNPGVVPSAVALREPKLSIVVDRQMQGAVMQVLTRQEPIQLSVPDLGQAIDDAAVIAYQRDYGRPPPDSATAVAQYGGPTAIAAQAVSLAVFSWMGWTFLRVSGETWVALRGSALAELSKGPVNRITEAIWTWVLHAGGLLVRQHHAPRMAVDLHVVRFYCDPGVKDSNWRSKLVAAFAFLQDFAICTTAELLKKVPPTPVLADVAIQGNTYQATIARNVLNVPLLRPKTKKQPAQAATANTAPRLSYFYDCPARVMLSSCAPAYTRTQRALLRFLFLSVKRGGRSGIHSRTISLGIVGDLLAEADYPGRSNAEMVHHLAKDLARVVEQDLGGSVSPPISSLTSTPVDQALKIEIRVEGPELRTRCSELIRERTGINLLPATGGADGSAHDVQPLTLAVESFGSQLRGMRIRAGISQVELARDAEVAVRTIQRVESGKAKPTQKTAAKLAEVLDFARGGRNPTRHVAHPETQKATRCSSRAAKSDTFLTPGCNVESTTAAI